MILVCSRFVTKLILFSFWTLFLGTVFNGETVGKDRFQKYFDEYSVSGSTTIYDLSNNKWIYALINVTRSGRRYPHPHSRS